MKTFKGIHQAAKNLEKKAKAKERRHIALILSQRLGTQVSSQEGRRLRAHLGRSVSYASVKKREGEAGSSEEKGRRLSLYT